MDTDGGRGGVIGSGSALKPSRREGRRLASGLRWRALNHGTAWLIFGFTSNGVRCPFTTKHANVQEDRQGLERLGFDLDANVADSWDLPDG